MNTIAYNLGKIVGRIECLLRGKPEDKKPSKSDDAKPSRDVIAHRPL